ncbi:Component of oligomeric Golgi complex 7 [Aphelenchoides bicaudatus]|nr:Component of oligomeric Golgi complex 7 [Aphelenchoides bicaudatus]
MDANNLAQIIKSRLRTTSNDRSSILNLAELSATPQTTQAALNTLIDDYAVRIRSCRHEIASNAVLSKIRELGNASQRLDKRLQSHIQMLRRNEGSFIGTNEVLEYDSAKTRSDKLVEVINAKKAWTDTLRNIDTLGEQEQNELFNYLVTLQQANVVFNKYLPCRKREDALERRKDHFLSWFPSAVSFAIGSSNVEELVALKEKYVALDRLSDYEKAFSAAIKQQILNFMTTNREELTLWQLLDETFSIWKRTNKLAVQVLGSEKGSDYVALNCYEGIRTQDEIVEEALKRLITNAENVIVAAKELSTTRKDFLDYLSVEGDQSITLIISKLCDDFYKMISDDYAKHVKSMLFTKINVISQVANQRNTKKHDWIQPLLEDVHSTMREIINESVVTFGSHFSQYVVPTFEKAVDQLNSTFRKGEILSSKNEADKLGNESDNLTCICIAGYLINMISDVNSFIHETHLSVRDTNSPRDSAIIQNKTILERFAKKIVQEKVRDVAASLVEPMTTEMLALIQSASTNEPADRMKISLPTFSISPHNYITVVGHGLLQQMNNLNAYNTDKNFRTAIMTIAGNSAEDECDLFMFRAIVNHLMERYVQNVGDPAKLPLKLAKQFNVDTVFLLDALQDLRLEPLPNLTVLAENLTEICARQQ